MLSRNNKGQKRKYGSNHYRNLSEDKKEKKREYERP